MISAIRRLAAALVIAAVPTAAFAQQSTITVYTSQPTEQMDAVIAAFNAEHPEIKVDVFRSGTTEVMSKLQANSPPARWRPTCS